MVFNTSRTLRSNFFLQFWGLQHLYYWIPSGNFVHDSKYQKFPFFVHDWLFGLFQSSWNFHWGFPKILFHAVAIYFIGYSWVVLLLFINVEIESSFWKPLWCSFFLNFEFSVAINGSVKMLVKELCCCCCVWSLLNHFCLKVLAIHF